MYILAVDTATNAGGAALSRGDEVIGSVMIKAPLRYSETLIPLIDFLLAQHDLRLEQVEGFAVASGPGSFTGLRVGIATVKAFCQALDRPAVGISTLEALAYRFRWVDGWIAPVIDARRKQIFAALYRAEEDQVYREGEERVLRPEEWLRELPVQEGAFVGDGVRVYRETIERLRPQGRVLETDNRILEALCGLAYRRFREGRGVSAHELAANYVRPSDAELGRRDLQGRSERDHR